MSAMRLVDFGVPNNDHGITEHRTDIISIAYKKEFISIILSFVKEIRNKVNYFINSVWI